MKNLKLYLTALRNIFIGGNLMSLSLLTRPREYVTVISTMLFYFRTLSGKGRLEQKNPDEVLPSTKKYDLKIDTDCYFWGVDPSYVKDILTLSILAKLTKAQNIFEIGTLDGYSSLHFAMNSSETTTVYSLDLPPDGHIKPSLNTTAVDVDHQEGHAKIRTYRFQNTEYEPKVKCLFGDSATYDYSPFYDKIDLFFIDGAHSYEYVKSDTLYAMKCVREGGVIAWHDYGRMGVNGVSKWLREFASQGHKCYSVPGSSLAYFIKGPENLSPLATK